MKDVVSLTLPAKPEMIPVLRAAAKEYANRLGFPKSDIQLISLALAEAALYNLEFGYGAPDDTFAAAFSRTSLGIQLTLRSKGLPLEEEKLPKFDLDRFSMDVDSTGLSSHLVRNIVDKVTFTTYGSGERETTLIKNFPASEKNLSCNDVAQEESSAKSTNYSIRIARPNDAEGISRLALRSHGNVFFNEQIYYPERVREMLEQGEMVSVVAENAEGRLIAHGALVSELPGACTEELTFGFTDASYRGLGCMNDVAIALLENAAAREVYALCSLAVTNHVHSQRAAHHLGLRDCVLLLAVSPASKSWRKGKNGDPARIANLGMIKYLGEVDAAPVYVPKHHHTMVERIFENLGAKKAFVVDVENQLPESETCLKTFSELKEGWATIMIQEYGMDVVRQVAAQHQLFCSQDLPFVNLFLPLNDSCTCFMSEEFERLGFFFAGLGPGLDGRENLVLQYLNRTDPTYDSIEIQSTFGQELLAYIQSCDPGLWREAEPASG